MTQDRRSRWVPVVVAVATLVPAAFLSALLLFDACFDARGGTGRPSARAAVCSAWDGDAVLACLAAVVVVGLGALVVAVRRGASARAVWVLAALPTLGLVLLAVLVGLVPSG